MTDIRTVFRYFLENRLCSDDLAAHRGAGVYAIFAETQQCLPNIELPQSGLLYIGQSGNLAHRNHFKEKYKRPSTVRRSLGAILKSELELNAEPRLTGRSPSNYKNYCFGDQGETCLSKWMKKNLTCAIFLLDSDEHVRKIIEKRLIKEYEPPLNLINWQNPQKKMIEKLREDCREKAKIVWQERL